MQALHQLERILRSTLAVSLCLSLAACGGPDASRGESWQAVYDTIADTVVVTTIAGSVWGDTAELVADVTIGEFEGSDEYMFGRVRSLAVASDGTIYAFDSHLKTLRMYAPDGTYLATIGREGGGPGEYSRPDGGLGVLPDGRVLLRDPGNTRVSVYAPDGEYIENWRIRGSFNTSRRLYVDTAGNALTLILLDPGAQVTEWEFGLVAYGPDGVPNDTIPAPVWDYEPPELVAQRVDGEDQSTSVSGVPFSPSTGWTYSPLGYMVGGLSTRYAIDLFIAPEQVLRIQRDNWVPARVRPEEREEQERIQTANMRQTEPGWRWSGDPIPDEKPPFRGIFIGERGRIWVRLHQEAYQIETYDTREPERPGEVPEQTWFEPVVFDVFEPDGRYLGVVKAPEGFSRYPGPVARGDTVWAVVRDDLDVPYVVRFHIEHPRAET